MTCGMVGTLGTVCAEPPAPPQTPSANPVDPVETGYRTLAEATIGEALTDPDSAKFKWNPKPYTSLTEYRSWRFAPAISGNLVMICGRVNAKNQMGGYVGYRWFDVILKDCGPASHRIDSGDDNTVSNTCQHASTSGSSGGRWSALPLSLAGERVVLSGAAEIVRSGVQITSGFIRFAAE